LTQFLASFFVSCKTRWLHQTYFNIKHKQNLPHGHIYAWFDFVKALHIITPDTKCSMA